MICKIYLSGESSPINNIVRIKRNISYALRLLDIPFNFVEPHTKGWKILEEEVNEPDVLYIFNDTVQYHLSNKPCILLSRSIPWLQSDPKPNCIGRLTHEMIESDHSVLMALIARNTPIRKYFDHTPGNTYLLFSEYVPSTLDAHGRNGFAASTWNILSKKDIHLKVLPYQSEGKPFVNDMLKDGMQALKHPDDILVLLNRDICLVPEFSGILRSYMDSLHLDMCFAKRVDVQTASPKLFKDLQGGVTYEGIDLFAFRKDADISGIGNVDLLMGAEGWDRHGPL